jgi:8-oxo-dGTP diphosphatase
MVTEYQSLELARADAAARGVRQKAVCWVCRAGEVLVFEHQGQSEAGVQLPAGGVEAGETPAQAAARELFEESGLSLGHPVHLVSYLWQARLPHRDTEQVCHAYLFTAPDHLPPTWMHAADGHTFVYAWVSTAAPGLDWEMDAALPYLPRLDPALEPTA